MTAFGERGIQFIPNRRVSSLDPARRVAILDDASEIPYDLFLGVPKHRVPAVVLASGMAENGWIPVNPKTLETRFPQVYAVGDGSNTGTPKWSRSHWARGRRFIFRVGANRHVSHPLRRTPR